MSDLVGNPEDRFSRVAAHVILMITNLKILRRVLWFSETKVFLYFDHLEKMLKYERV